MRDNPIIEELRAIRKELEAESNGDLNLICQKLAEWEALHPERMVARTIAPLNPEARAKWQAELAAAKKE